MLPFLFIGVMACAAREKPADASAPPPWSTAEGQEAARDELASMLLEQGSPEAALQIISRSRDAGEKGPTLDLLQGKALARAGLPDDAIPWLERVGRRTPQYGEARDELGLIYMERRELDTATTLFRQAVSADPRNPKYLNNLGFALMSSGRHAEAIEPLRAALAADGGQPRTRNNLGFALVATGRDDEAFRVFRSAGSEANACYNLALGIELRGAATDAIPWYERSLTADPLHLEARAALARLRSASAADTQTVPAPQESP